MTLHNWILAIRPKTLWASIAPVLLGTAMAYGDGLWHRTTAIVCLVGALAVQVGTNLANDYFDAKSGVDTADRRGPLRVTQTGLISPRAVRTGFTAAFMLAAVCCIYLTFHCGWSIIILGILAIVLGLFYSAGPWPLSHLGLGELFVLIFFGPVAVGATYYCQSHELNWAVLLAGVACGFYSTAIIAVNNLRDIPTDRKAGKNTLAVRFGPAFARREYLFCILAAAAVPPVIYLITDQHPWTLLSSAVIFAAIPLIDRVFTTADPSELNGVLAQTGSLLMIFTAVFSAGWIK